MIIFGDMIALYNCTHSIVAHGLDRLGMDCHTALKTGPKIGDFGENYMILCRTLRDFAGCMHGTMWVYAGLYGTGWHIWGPNMMQCVLPDVWCLPRYLSGK